MISGFTVIKFNRNKNYNIFRTAARQFTKAGNNIISLNATLKLKQMNFA